MPATYSTSLRLKLIADGDESGTWGASTNTNLGAILEQAIAGSVTVNMADANRTLSALTFAIDEARAAVIIVTGTNTAIRDVIAPLVPKVYIIKNSTSGGFDINIRASSGAAVTIYNGTASIVYCDGTNFYSANPGVSTFNSRAGAVTLTSADILAVLGYIPPSPQNIQYQSQNTAVAGGSANVITASYTPAITSLVAGLRLSVRASFANTTTTPTFAANATTPTVIVRPDLTPLLIGDISGVGHGLDLHYDTSGVWVLQNPAMSRDIYGGNSKLESLTATVAANALTITLNPTSLDFRNNILATGTPINRVISAPVSVTVPSGATLGLRASAISQLFVMAMDVSGVIELVVASNAGILNLDEWNLHSTTALSGTSNSAGVLYSITARSGRAMKLVGMIQIACSAPGLWTAAPTKIATQGISALPNVSGLGRGQLWTDVTVSRLVNTTYYNDTDRPMSVSATINGVSTGTATVSVQGLNIAVMSFNSTSPTIPLTFIVPSGEAYSINVTGTFTYTWFELR